MGHLPACSYHGQGAAAGGAAVCFTFSKCDPAAIGVQPEDTSTWRSCCSACLLAALLQKFRSQSASFLRSGCSHGAASDSLRSAKEHLCIFSGLSVTNGFVVLSVTSPSDLSDHDAITRLEASRLHVSPDLSRILHWGRSLSHHTTPRAGSTALRKMWDHPQVLRKGSQGAGGCVGRSSSATTLLS